MKVSNNAPTSSQLIEKAKNADRSKEAASTSSKSGLDSAQILTNEHAGANVQISDKAKLMQQATELVRNSPDIRQDKVNGLKKSIQDGSYHVDSAAIADRLVENHLNSGFGKNNL